MLGYSRRSALKRRRRGGTGAMWYINTRKEALASFAKLGSCCLVAQTRFPDPHPIAIHQTAAHTILSTITSFRSPETAACAQQPCSVRRKSTRGTPTPTPATAADVRRHGIFRQYHPSKPPFCAYLLHGSSCWRWPLCLPTASSSASSSPSRSPSCASPSTPSCIFKSSTNGGRARKRPGWVSSSLAAWGPSFYREPTLPPISSTWRTCSTLCTRLVCPHSRGRGPCWWFLGQIFLVVSTILWVISGGLIYQMWTYVECQNNGVPDSLAKFKSEVSGGLTLCHEIKTIEIIAWVIAAVSVVALIPVFRTYLKKRKDRKAGVATSSSAWWWRGCSCLSFASGWCLVGGISLEMREGRGPVAPCASRSIRGAPW